MAPFLSLLPSPHSAREGDSGCAGKPEYGENYTRSFLGLRFLFFIVNVICLDLQTGVFALFTLGTSATCTEQDTMSFLSIFLLWQ